MWWKKVKLNPYPTSYSKIVSLHIRNWGWKRYYPEKEENTAEQINREMFLMLGGKETLRVSKTGQCHCSLESHQWSVKFTKEIDSHFNLPDRQRATIYIFLRATTNYDNKNKQQNGWKIGNGQSKHRIRTYCSWKVPCLLVSTGCALTPTTAHQGPLALCSLTPRCSPSSGQLDKRAEVGGIPGIENLRPFFYSLYCEMTAWLFTKSSVHPFFLDFPEDSAILSWFLLLLLLFLLFLLFHLDIVFEKPDTHLTLLALEGVWFLCVEALGTFRSSNSNTFIRLCLQEDHSGSIRPGTSWPCSGCDLPSLSLGWLLPPHQWGSGPLPVVCSVHLFLLCLSATWSPTPGTFHLILSALFSRCVQYLLLDFHLNLFLLIISSSRLHFSDTFVLLLLVFSQWFSL